MHGEDGTKSIWFDGACIHVYNLSHFGFRNVFGDLKRTSILWHTYADGGNKQNDSVNKNTAYNKNAERNNNNNHKKNDKKRNELNVLCIEANKGTTKKKTLFKSMKTNNL